SADLIALQIQASEPGKELANAVHGIAMTPGIHYPGRVPFAESEHGFIPGAREIAEGGYLAVNDFGRVIDDCADVFEADHGIASVVQKTRVVFNRKNAILEVLAIGFDLSF